LGQAVALILDAGPCRGGLESTIVAVEGERAALLRPGGIARADIEAIAGRLEAPASIRGAPRSPGQLASHYAPKAKLRLISLRPEPGEGYLAFGPDAPDH
ncbi:translation factor Sua5, partial [Marinicauda algicola]